MMKRMAMVLGLAAAMAGCEAVGIRGDRTVVVRPERDVPYASYDSVTVKLPPDEEYKGGCGGGVAV